MHRPTVYNRIATHRHTIAGALSRLKIASIRHALLLTITVMSLCVVDAASAVAAPPTVGAEFAHNVSATSAELIASVNPELSDTSYQFEYVADDVYDGAASNPYAAGGTAPASAVDIGGGEEPVRAQTTLSVLTPATEYHYRVVATSAEGTSVGPDRTFRTFASNLSTLGDGRVWEMVSPLEKNSADIEGIDDVSAGGVVQASPDGSKITYLSFGSFAAAGEPGSQPEGAPIAGQYLASRDSGGWSTKNISTPMRSFEYALGEGAPYKAFSSDLTLGLLPSGEHTGSSRPPEAPPLGGAPAGYYDDYLRNLSNGSVQALYTGTPSVSPETFGELRIQGVTPDLTSGIVVSNDNALTPGASAGGEGEQNLYEWKDGQFEAVNIPPNPTVPGETVLEAVLGSGEEYPLQTSPADESHTISSDGGRVFWQVRGREGGHLFARENIGTPEAKTIAVDTAAGGDGSFWTASSDGSKVFFTRGAHKSDLYEYDLTTEATVDLAPSGEVLGVLGAGEDGAEVYFVADAVLAPGAEPGDCGEGGQGGGVGNFCSLYVSEPDTAHPGARKTVFIAKLSGEDETGHFSFGIHDWHPSMWARTTRVTRDGRNVVFMSNSRIPASAFPDGFENADVLTGAADEEVYEYELGSSGPVCVSCNHSNERPLGPSSIPGGTQFTHVQATYDSRVLSDDGDRVFFDSDDSVLPSDTNATQDVYEWEREGVGSCPVLPASAELHGAGCQYLVSGGQDSEPSSFVDASSTGDDVFFITRQQLAGRDTDELVDLYDARVDGVPSPPALTGTSCTGENCLPPVASAPVFGAPGSLAFAGPGNLAPPPPTVVKPLTKAQKLAKALKACKAIHGSAKRAACETKARKKYGPAVKKPSTKKTKAKKSNTSKRDLAGSYGRGK